MKLIITEKPSVAQSIAHALGVKERKDGYLEGDGLLIAWCVGHLVGLSAPESYGTHLKTWRVDDLPVLPDPWRLTVLEGKEKPFAVVKQLMQDERVTSLVCATDAGREGELIFRLVYEEASCKKPFERLWLASMEKHAIQDAFSHLGKGADYDGLYASALCRAKADWLVGMNMTRLFSCLHQTPLHVGRVQTPTLAMLVEREKQIAQFQKEKSYTLDLVVEGVCVQSHVQPDRESIEAIQRECENQPLSVVSLIRQEQRISPPSLYDLTTLQREANRIYGYTAQQTLDRAQSLYEKKYLTYPRTDSRHLTQDMRQSTLALIESVCHRLDYAPFEADVSRMIDDEKVSDHHALLPTKRGLTEDISVLSSEEREVFMLVAKRLVVAAASPCLLLHQEAELVCGSWAFHAKGNRIIQAGFTAWEENEKREKNALPEWVQGQSLYPDRQRIEEHESSPPKRFSEDTLLSAMERAGQSADCEKKGIGTPATRAGVIEKLVKSDYAIRKGKQLFPTEKGTALISILPEHLRSPQQTAEWEQALSSIAKDEKQADTFLTSIQDELQSIIETQKKEPIQFDLFQQKREQIGVCPRCGKNVYESPKVFCCEDRACGFALWKEDLFFRSRKKKLSKAMATTLLKKGKVHVKGMFSEKTGKTYDADVCLNDAGSGYVRYRLEFQKKTKDGGKK